MPNEPMKEGEQVRPELMVTVREHLAKKAMKEGDDVAACPFCGGDAAHGLWGDRRMAVRCMRCDAKGPSTDVVPEICINIRPFIDQAYAAWNTRPHPASPSAPDETSAVGGWVLAQLRHAYAHLAAERVTKQREFADGLIAPAIRALEALPRAEPSVEVREKLARIIEPDAWKWLDRDKYVSANSHIAHDSLTKADAILSLFSDLREGE